MTTFYVDPSNGSDRGGGTHQMPFQTLAYCLGQAPPESTIYLAAGSYNLNTGERFPLIVPPGVMVVGQEAHQGKGVHLRGSGGFDSPTFRRQEVTVVLHDRAQLRGVTVSNPNERGVGVWIESASPLLLRNTIAHCGLAGIVVTGVSKPQIYDNLLINTGSTGIFLRRQSKGEIRHNDCQQLGYGITVSDDCAPLVADNVLSQNQVGLYLSHRAMPVLRRNRLAKNQATGLFTKDQAAPDFGHAQAPAGNRFESNGQWDIQHTASGILRSGGNELNAQRLKGSVEIITLEVPANFMGPAEFRDVGSHWAQEFISVLVNLGLFQGFPDGSFRPEGPLTRAEFAALLGKTFDLPRQVGTRPSFRDVPTNFWGHDAILKASQMGFLAGYADGTFRPEQKLTRVQALVSLVNGLGMLGGSVAVLQAYDDRAQIPSYATSAIATATEKRLLANYPDPRQLRPMQPITRAEIAVFLHQALVTVDRATAITSPYIVNPEPYLAVFPDVVGHWAEDFLRRLASLSYISGFSDGTFRPDAPLNRAQYAALLVKMLKPPAKRPPTMFLDVAPDFWGYGAIAQAYQSGFISGFPDSTFHPDQPLKRVNLIVSLVSGLALPGGNLDQLQQFRDRAEIPAYAQDEVAAAIGQQLIASYPDPAQLNPKQEATRAEAAVMLYQVLVYQGQVGAIDSPYVV